MKRFSHAFWLLSALFVSVHSGGVLAIGHNLNEELLQAVRSGDIRTV
ncbi:MAG: hypothetical protein HKN08_01855, partial [Gammaproteobacteria bacterium]|nr:hypothetical protein [Gammaproteobacteria bacterium]